MASGEANKTGGAAALRRLLEPERAATADGARLRLAGAALWIPQAAALAYGLGAAMAGGADALASAAAAAAAFFALALLRTALEAMGQARLGAAAERVEAAARAEVAAIAAAGGSVDAGARAEHGRLAALGAELAGAIEAYVAGYAPAVLKLKVAPALLLLATLYVSWTAALALAAMGLAAPILMARVGRAAKAASDRQLDEIGSMNALLLDRLRALPDLRLLGAVDHARGAFADAAERVRTRTMAVLKVAFLTSASLEICASAGVALVAVAVGAALSGATSLGAWDGVTTVEEALFALLLAPEFFQHFRDFAAAYHDRAGAESFASALDAAVESSGQPALGRGAPAAPLQAAGPDAPAIAFRGVRFGYAPSTPRRSTAPAPVAIEALDLSIRQGERVGLTGPSGAGKSTVLALIAGLLRPSSGEILALGRPLDAETADAWRAHIAWIGQKPHALAGSLRANIAFYAPEAVGDRGRLAAAARLAQAEDVVARAPKGYDAPLGETGAGLSGGELRRIGVARVAFSGRPIILADEPTAALDAETAAKVADGLLALAARDGATLIAATHDAAFAARLDRLIELGSARDAAMAATAQIAEAQAS